MAVAASDGGIVVDQHAAKIVFFDVETTVPLRTGQKYELLEFGAIVLDAQGLSEVHSYSTLIRPKDIGSISSRSVNCNGITKENVANAPTFTEVADEIHRVLNGRIWAGHNIVKFDMLRVSEAFSEISRPAPQPAGIIDTYPLLKKTFGKRAGNFKLETLANYCGFGKQEHRSLADVQMNLNVLKSCATMLFLESNYPNIFTGGREFSPRASTLQQSVTLSISQEQISKSRNEYLPEAEDFQSKLSESATVTTLSREHTKEVSFIKGKKANVEASESSIGITVGAKHSRTSAQLAFSDMLEECTSRYQVCHASNPSSGAVKHAGKSVFSDPSIAKHDMGEEDMLKGCGLSSTKISASEVITAGLGKSNIASSNQSTSSEHVRVQAGGSCDRPIKNDSSLAIIETELLCNNSALDKGGIEDLSSALFSLSLSELKDEQDVETSDSARSRFDESLTVQMSEQDSRGTGVGAPFFLASCISLALIEAQDQDYQFGCKKVLYHKGFPLQLLECKTKIRFTVNSKYAFDDRGKPRFSLLIEPSEPACEVISKCDDLIKTIMAEQGDEATWLPALRKDGGVWRACISIGTRGSGCMATYTTKFYRHMLNGLEKMALGHVDVANFRNLLPHGSVINIGFGFDVFSVNKRSGIRLLAKCITLA